MVSIGFRFACRPGDIEEHSIAQKNQDRAAAYSKPGKPLGRLGLMPVSNEVRD